MLPFPGKKAQGTQEAVLDPTLLLVHTLLNLIAHRLSCWRTWTVSASAKIATNLFREQQGKQSFHHAAGGKSAAVVRAASALNDNLGHDVHSRNLDGLGESIHHLLCQLKPWTTVRTHLFSDRYRLRNP